MRAEEPEEQEEPQVPNLVVGQPVPLVVLDLPPNEEMRAEEPEEQEEPQIPNLVVGQPIPFVMLDLSPNEEMHSEELELDLSPDEPPNPSPMANPWSSMPRTALEVPNAMEQINQNIAVLGRSRLCQYHLGMRTSQCNHPKCEFAH